MPITSQQLLQIIPNDGKQAGVFASALNLAMDRFQTTTRLRVAAFIAQVGHESGQFVTGCPGMVPYPPLDKGWGYTVNQVDSRADVDIDYVDRAVDYNRHQER